MRIIVGPSPIGVTPVTPVLPGDPGVPRRPVPPPDIFTPGFSSDLKSVIFTVGDFPTTRRGSKSQFLLYFAPISAASPAQMGDFSVAYNVFHAKAAVVDSKAVPANGGTVKLIDSVNPPNDGWYFGTAMNASNIESDFVGPVRTPIIGNNDSRVPPDVGDVAVKFFDGGLDPAGRQIVKARCSGTVPSQSQSVSTVTQKTAGTGYTHDFQVTFTGGGGTGAIGLAHVRDGTVISTTVVSGGTGYTSVPIVDYSLGDGMGASGEAILTVTGSMSGIQMYLGNYNQAGILVESAEIKNLAPLPGDTISGDVILLADSPPVHDVKFYFVALSQTGTRRADPTTAPLVDFPTGVHL